MHRWRRRAVIALVAAVLIGAVMYSPAPAQGSGLESEAVEAAKEELSCAIHFA